MRLINASSMQLEVYYNATERPPYAILSHRWIDGDEVTFEDMQRPHRQWMPAWLKIKMCCQQALADGLNHAWVDTCCIDKTSSAELSEAINSMYAWYSEAACCYVYLNDVNCVAYDQANSSLSAHPPIPTQVVQDIIASAWFTRAWTLQELIAPTKVIFYDSKFRHLGSKVDFASEIEQAFAIPIQVLMDPQRVWEYHLAARMSWAAHRRATRTEDIAYSLFGLFGVNLPLLYGEGMKSFTRLQEEIIRQTHDHSIFLWSSRQPRQGNQIDEHDLVQLPLLASSPADFDECQDVSLSPNTEDVRPYSLTNLGLEIELKVFPYHLDVHVGLLNCRSKSTGSPYGLLLTRTGNRAATWHRLRVRGMDLIRLDRPEQMKNFVWQKMYIVKHNPTIFAKRELSCHEVVDRPELPFYGLNINAPAFLTAEFSALRPYTLIAYRDMTTRFWAGDGDNDFVQNGYTADKNTRFYTHFHTSLDLESIAFIEKSLTNPEHRSERHDSLGHHRQLDSASASVSKVPLGVFAMPLMSTGTAGLVVFDQLVHGVKAIKTGFDFNFRPVIYIATHDAQIESDPMIHNWMQARQYIPTESFETLRDLLYSSRVDPDQIFWTIDPDYLTHRENLDICDDGSIFIHKGIYAFVSEARAEPQNWVFKPCGSQHWHLALGLEKRKNKGVVYWEFSMDRREDLVKLEFDLLS